MNTTTQLKVLSNKIADAIVDLVNDTDGPVTLSQVEREVPGFAKNGAPVWYFAFPQASGDQFVWGNMTEAGEVALREIIYGKRLAVQFVTPQPYLIEGGTNYIDRSDWLPIMLLPARSANISTNLLARLSPQSLEDTLASTPSNGRAAFRLLKPHPLRFAADCFSVGDPRNRFSALLMHATAA
jgi:hypothetical protein